mmetsp:Transcript_55863/g.120813  ORF Transcript_55863/g.120813 Transcript_55863/m.120813 type:complete len:527 (+) Transcript_55863:133-1713(+)
MGVRVGQCFEGDLYFGNNSTCFQGEGLGLLASSERDISTMQVAAWSADYMVRLLVSGVIGWVSLVWSLSVIVGAVLTLKNAVQNKCRRRVPFPDSTSQGVWTIHGKHYDLSSWASHHPGGKFALDLGRNRDCTGLFESYHIFANQDMLKKTLARYELSSEEAALRGVEASTEGNATGLEFNDPFHADVKAMAREHFGERSHKMKLSTGVVCGFFLVAQMVAICAFLAGSQAAVFLLPFVSWIVSSNLAHDASHFAISRRPWLNRLASYTSLPFFFGSTGWHLQHVVQHHVYTNDSDDVDLYHFLPAVRVSRLTKHSEAFKLQLLSFFVVLPTVVGHLLFTVPMDLLTGQLDAATGERRYSQAQGLDDFVGRFFRSILFEFIGGICWIPLSLYCLGFHQGLGRICLVYTVCSYLFVIFTQGAHLQKDCMVGKEEEFKSWARRQAATSVNFGVGSGLLCFVAGGLNMQSLHHVLPGVSSCHFSDLWPKYKEVCRRHGVELKECSSLFSFFGGFLGWLSELAVEAEDER